MIFWMKFIHIAAVAIWTAGLISLPGLYVRRTRVESREELYDLQRVVRGAYVTMVSPAAFVAIGSGMALIFLRETFVPWFSVKLLLVGALVALHAVTGLVIIRLFRDDQVFPAWRFVLVTVLTLCLVGFILFLVLAKPAIDAPVLPAVFSEPGGLKRLFDELSPWETP